MDNAILAVLNNDGNLSCLKAFADDRDRNKSDEHHWANIVGPGGNVTIDPWPSGGGLLVDTSGTGGQNAPEQHPLLGPNPPVSGCPCNQSDFRHGPTFSGGDFGGGSSSGAGPSPM